MANKKILHTDYLIIGAGYYGLYAADILSKNGMHITVIEIDKQAFTRASYANQARIHNGYHYPRSLATAKKTQHYFSRFNQDYGFCVKDDFAKIYGIARNLSYTTPKQFESFCSAANIPCEIASVGNFFNTSQVTAAYMTAEYSYDAIKLRDYMVRKVTEASVNINCDVCINSTEIAKDYFLIDLDDGTRIKTPRVLNASYASINQVNKLFGFRGEPIKYELCEVIIIEANDALRDVALTVMDGPFFSIMPFGNSGFHTLTSVAFTPHQTSYDVLPYFSCQEYNQKCSIKQLANCNTCTARPNTAWPYMNQLARKFLNPKLDFDYKDSLFAIKPILRASEIDDSRPTLIRRWSMKPSYITVLSGKINTVFDLEEVLLDDFSS